MEYIFFIIQDFLATCACPANRVALKFLKTGGAAAFPDPPRRTPMDYPDSHQNPMIISWAIYNIPWNLFANSFRVICIKPSN